MIRKYVEIISWNTGRLYTAEGQRIAAGRTAEGTVHFVDIDRQISGILTDQVPFHVAHVMQEYDHNRYDGDDIDRNLMWAAKQ